MPIVISLLLSGFIGMFSETALNIALTDLMKELNVGPTTIQWLTTGYLLVLGILVPISGLLLQWFTTRQLFVASVSFSTLGSLVAAMAPNFEVLLVARVFQAAGTGLLLPLLFNTILVIFPPAKRGAAMGMMGLVIMFAPAIGPTIAGLLIEKLTWHWIFWISFAVLLISLIVGIVFLQNVSKITRPKIDLLSIVLSTAGFGGLVFGFSKAGESDGWGSASVIASLVIGGVALILFVWRQLTMENPMMDLRAFRYPMFTLAVIMLFVVMMVLLSSMLVLPMFLQNGLGRNALSAGLLLLPGGIINGLMSPIMGRLFDKYGPKWLVIPGLVIIASILWLMSGITTASTAAFIIAMHSCLMIGISMVMMPAQTNGLNQLPPEFYPHGTAIMNTLQQVAGAIGTALAVSILSAGQEKYLGDQGFDVSHGLDPANLTDPSIMQHLPNAFAYGVKNAFIFAVSMAVVALICSFFIKRVKVGKA
ncbi:DHA2 family efflux MFS transporter permease subunit [Paenibacillus pinihumi]|uniref:DHA2 family efflux MFS transporter permease subunit n=1 Tax=Paenibacillus pinihumi TaxID=669462 RepID=UPI0006877369|nr:DHA2 family efflux MFS transporter permease subunit [Paenibacillus pinihumi]